ncbi:MAG: hypothetical protein DRP45_11155 [Candidatus Zixiibacteriota bacterium]|nr:MAG: hypothetical protein DRP45_11155 [candidate division Zixibacteria bacterium]
MKRAERTIMLLVMLTAAFIQPVLAERLKDQAVTYANFDFVYSVTASMDHVYFATNGGIIRYSQIDQKWDEPLTGARGMENETATEIWVNTFDDKLCISTDIGYYEYDQLFDSWLPIFELPTIRNDNHHIDVPDHLIPDFNANYMGDGRFIDIHGRSWSISDVVDDGFGTLWIGTWGFGPATAHPTSGNMKLLPYGLLQKRVNAILPDDTVIWVSGAVFGDFRTGLTAFNPEQNSFFYVESGLFGSFPAEDVNCLAADEENLFVGTPHGIYLIEREGWTVDRQISHRRGLPDDNVLSLAVLGSGLYVGTATGLILIDLVTDSVGHIRPGTFLDHPVLDLEPVDSSLWIASVAGAFRYSPATDRLQRYQDPELVLFSTVYDIEKSENCLWFTSDAGVVRLNTKTAASSAYRDRRSCTDSRPLVANDSVSAVASDLGMRLIFWDADGPFSREFTTDDGLASDNVLALLMDGDYVWIGTDRGLTRFLWNNPDRVD